MTSIFRCAKTGDILGINQFFIANNVRELKNKLNRAE